LPRTLLVLGGGFIGCELACMAAMLGVKVTIVELLGAETHVICATPDGTRVIVRQPPQATRPAPRDQVRIAVDPAPTALHLFDAASTQRLTAP